MKYDQTLVISFLCLHLGACVEGGGYMASRIFNKNSTLTFPSFQDTQLSEDGNALLKQYLGDYQVKKSWGNIVDNTQLVKIRFDNNKVSLSVYPENWTVPHYKMEFETCDIVKKLSKYHRLQKVNQHLECYGRASDGLITSMELGRPTADSTGFSPNLEFLTSILIDGRQVPINQFDYVLSYLTWIDAPEPLLGLAKIR